MVNKKFTNLDDPAETIAAHEVVQQINRADISRITDDTKNKLYQIIRGTAPTAAFTTLFDAAHEGAQLKRMEEGLNALPADVPENIRNEIRTKFLNILPTSVSFVRPPATAPETYEFGEAIEKIREKLAPAPAPAPVPAPHHEEPRHDEPSHETPHETQAESSKTSEVLSKYVGGSAAVAAGPLLAASAAPGVLGNVPLIGPALSAGAGYLGAGAAYVSEALGLNTAAQALAGVSWMPQSVAPWLAASGGPALAAAAMVPVGIFALGKLRQEIQKGLGYPIPKNEGGFKAGFKTIGQAIALPFWAPFKLAGLGAKGTKAALGGLWSGTKKVASTVTHLATRPFHKDRILWTAAGAGAAIFMTGGLSIFPILAYSAGTNGLAWLKDKIAAHDAGSAHAHPAPAPHGA